MLIIPGPHYIMYHFVPEDSSMAPNSVSWEMKSIAKHTKQKKVKKHQERKYPCTCFPDPMQQDNINIPPTHDAVRVITQANITFQSSFSN